MKVKEGETVKSTLNGKSYKIKKIIKHMAVLESPNGKSQILKEVESLNLFYRKKEDIKV